MLNPGGDWLTGIKINACYLSENSDCRDGIDQENPVACKFGLWLLENERKTLAVEWLQRAAYAGVADAMKWLKQVAAHGHLIAQRQVAALGL